MPPTEPATSFVNVYGPYAFGVAAVVVLVVLAVWVWMKVGASAMTSRVRIAEAEARTAASLDSLAKHLAEANKDALETSRVLRDIAAQRGGL